jgi:hypothetical protein
MSFYGIKDKLISETFSISGGGAETEFNFDYTLVHDFNAIIKVLNSENNPVDEETVQVENISDVSCRITFDSAPADDYKIVVHGIAEAYILESMIIYQTDEDSNTQIKAMLPDGTGKINLSNNAHNDIAPYVSDDANWIVFGSDRSGSYQVYRGRLTLSGIQDAEVISSEPTPSVAGLDPIITKDNDIVIWVGRSSTQNRVYIRAYKFSTDTLVTLSDGLGISYRKAALQLSDDETKLYYSWVPVAGGSWTSRRGTFSAAAMTLSSNGNITPTSNNKYAPLVNKAGDKLIMASGSWPELNLVKYDFDGTNGTNGVTLTNLSSHELFAEYSPDETEIVYRSSNGGDNEIRVRPNVDSVDNGTQITTNTDNDSVPVWRKIRRPRT